jgi:hypothetical protein
LVYHLIAPVLKNGMFDLERLGTVRVGCRFT